MSYRPLTSDPVIHRQDLDYFIQLESTDGDGAPNLGDPETAAFIDYRDANGIPAKGRVWPGVTFDNLLVNGGFDIFQRTDPTSLTARPNDSYGPDRWVMLTQTDSVEIGRVIGNVSRNALRINQNQATAQRFGMIQIIESFQSYPTRRKEITFEGRVKISNSQALRVALLEWTGTADSVSSDVVNDWTSGSYTAGNFFLASNLNVLGVADFTPDADTWTHLSVNGTISSSCNNLLVMLWTEGTASQGVLLDVTGCDLHLGDFNRVWTPRPIGDEILTCQRYFEKSFDLDVAPAAGVASGTQPTTIAFSTNTLQSQEIFYLQNKRVPPTITTYSPSQGGSSGRWPYFQTSGGTWEDPETMNVFSAGRTKSFICQITDTGLFITNRPYLTVGHYVADAEL